MGFPSLFIATACTLCLIPNAFSQQPLANDRLVTLEGEWIEARVESIDSSGRVLLENDPRPWELEDLRSITPATSSSETASLPAGSQSLLLACGSELVGEQLTLVDDTISLNFRGSPFSISIDAARGLRFQPAQSDSRFEKALTEIAQDRDVDRLFLVGTGAGEMQEVTGLIVAFDRETLTIDLQGESRNLPMENVHGILLATPLLAEDEREITEVHLNGGSTLVAEIQSLKKGNLNLLLIESTPLELSWSDVRSLTIRSALLVYLSDLQPSVVNHEPILALPREWQRDRNVQGKTLRLGDVDFSKGLGVAAGTSITFENTEPYDLLTAVIGIDSSRGPQGDCEFVVFGDGNELARHRARGGEAPKTLRVETKSFKTITLYVDPGEGFIDLADDANWADACFITLKRK